MADGSGRPSSGRPRCAPSRVTIEHGSREQAALQSYLAQRATAQGVIDDPSTQEPQPSATALSRNSSEESAQPSAAMCAPPSVHMLRTGSESPNHSAHATTMSDSPERARGIARLWRVCFSGASEEPAPDASNADTGQAQVSPTLTALLPSQQPSDSANVSAHVLPPTLAWGGRDEPLLRVRSP